jgi:hypothetical protein
MGPGCQPAGRREARVETMRGARASVSQLVVMLIVLATTPGLTVLMNGQGGQSKQEQGAPSDWTHHHLIFSHPGTADDAILTGTYERWLTIVTDPRYILQRQKRSANASGATDGSSSDVSSTMSPAVEPNLRTERDEAGVQREEDNTGAIEMSLEERNAAQLGNRRLPSGLARATVPPAIEQSDATFASSTEAGSPLAAMIERKRERREHEREHERKRRNRIHKDWSETLGSNGTTGLGEFPTTFTATAGVKSCTADFAVFNTGLAGAPGQANIIAYNNLYSTCNGGAPTVYWAYNTGGTVVNSVTLSLNGSQVAFVQSSSSGVASFVLLTWLASNGTLIAPASPTAEAAGSYNGCTAPCVTTLTFSGSPSDTYSSPFIVYGQGGNPSSAYVGDDVGNLHKFTNIFASGTNAPAEAASPWPVVVNSNASLGTPIYDSVSTNLFVGDYRFSSSSPCEPSATNANNPCGYLYSVNTSGTVTRSAQLDFNMGIMDGPIVDSSASEVYVFAGDDGSTNCAGTTPCAAVYQFPVNFNAGASGTKATVGLGYEFMLSGTFDNAYFTSSTHSGHLYVVGNTGPANNTLYQVSITSNVMSTSSTAGPEVSSNYINGYYSAGLQVSEFYAGGTNDYIFLSVLSYGFPSGCAPASLANGCIIGYNVNSGTISASTAATGATAEAGGTSGIVVDSGTAGAQNIYFSTLLNQSCTTSGGTGGCAIQTSQSAP